MATATQTAEPKTEGPSDALTTYVVVSDAVTVTTGRKANGRAQYTRILKGGTFKGRPDADTVGKFLRLGSVKPVANAAELAKIRADLKGERSRHRLTVRKASKLSGAADDPVAAPVKGIEPLDAPLPRTDPAIITAESLGDE